MIRSLIGTVIRPGISSVLSSIFVPSAAPVNDEYFPTPDFNNSNGVIDPGSWTISGGTAAANGDSQPMLLTPAITLTAGVYHVEVTISTNNFGDQIIVQLGGVGGAQGLTDSDLNPTTGVFEFDLTLGGGFASQLISINENSGVPVTITAVSITKTS